MFLSFKNKRSRNQNIANSAQDKIAIGIVNKTIGIQEKGAAFMQHQTERLSGREKKLMIVMFFSFIGRI